MPLTVWLQLEELEGSGCCAPGVSMNASFASQGFALVTDSEIFFGRMLLSKKRGLVDHYNRHSRLWYGTCSTIKCQPLLNFLGFFDEHRLLVILFKSNQSFLVAPRPSKAEPTQRRSQDWNKIISQLSIFRFSKDHTFDLGRIVQSPVEKVSAP